MTITHICHRPGHNPPEIVPASDWLMTPHPGLWLAGPDPPHTGDNSGWGAANFVPVLMTRGTHPVSELMIIAIIIFLRPKVVQSINQMLISRCAWFIGRATNWAFYQETKCGNTEIPYILFIQKNLGLFMALATITDYTFTIKIIAMLLKYFWGCHCTGSANKCHQKGINWLAMDGAGNKINDIKNVFHVPKDTLADCSNTFSTDPRHVLVLFALSLWLVGKWVKLVCWFFVKQNN